ncbi:MAG: hypothetical protein JW793_02505 [Acidobacteria bacterium]|nr:hypothetical protein [Acidobacteriota bacterium]
MTFLFNLLGMLAFRSRSLELQAESRTVFGPVVFYASGFLAYTLLRHRVYAELPEIAAPSSGPVYIFWQISLIQTLLFLLIVFLPGLALLGKSIRGESTGTAMPMGDYFPHVSALMPLWGGLFFITAPVQWLAPHFLSFGILEVSVGMLARSVLLAVYTVWAVKQLNFLTTVQALGVFVLSCFALPVLFIMTYTWYADALLILAALFGLCFRRLRSRRLKKADII